MKKILHKNGVWHVVRVLVVLCVLGALSGCSIMREMQGQGQQTFTPTVTPLSVVTPPPAPPVAPVLPAPPEHEGPLTSPQIFAKNQFAVFQIFAYHTQHTGAWGSGFFICPSGIAVTNHHVMVGAGRAIAIMYDGTEFEIMGWHSYDFGNDLAVIQVDNRGGDFNYVTLGDSDGVLVGETIFAIGGPEGDPITFTDGMVSRLVASPIMFDGYSVSGMIQHTAAIYGGNSGGPLLDDRGRVVGINTAGRPDRPSVQFAVPANRIQIPAAGATANMLPLGVHMPWQPPQFTGDVTYLTRFAAVPDISSISPNARLIMNGTPLDLGEDTGWLSTYYEYLYIYALPEPHWIPDTDSFDAALYQRGFQFQNIVHFDIETWVYFFHPTHNLSVSYAFCWESETLLIAIGSGDAYTAFYHESGHAELLPPDRPPDQPPPYATRDAALFGAWQFWETTTALYHEWAGDGETLYYIFYDNGAGEFITFDQNDDIMRHFPFHWHTVNNYVTINYTTINLTLIYRFTADGESLSLTGAEDSHYLVFVP